MSLDKGIQAVRVYSGTKNAVETVRQLPFECEATSLLQLSHSFHSVFSPIIGVSGIGNIRRKPTSFPSDEIRDPFV